MNHTSIMGLLLALTAMLSIWASSACGNGGTAAPQGDGGATTASGPNTFGNQEGAAVTTPPPTSPSTKPALQPLPGTPVSRSDVRSAFGEPLSSGLSVADIVENALPSVVQIISGTGSGTGFIANESGLVVTNKHVVYGAREVTLRLVSGDNFQAQVAELHPSLDLAYLKINSSRSFTPIAFGDSDDARVGEEIIVIGFPLGQTLGAEPTISIGVISSKRDRYLQTDAAINPGNSGGPLFNMFGESIGVVTSRIESTTRGRSVSGIGFAIPINEVTSGLGGQASPSGRTLPTPTPTPFPAIAPTPDVEATRSAIQTVDAHRRQVEQATRTAVEAQQEAERYASSLEATRVAELPTPTPTLTPTPEPTPTPSPTPTPHPSVYCEEWESMVLEWIRQGNEYSPLYWNTLPEHPILSHGQARSLCLTKFPTGIFPDVFGRWHKVGTEPGEVLPGVYEYRQRSGDNRVDEEDCALILNEDDRDWTGDRIAMTYGEPFTIELFTYLGHIYFVHGLCYGKFYRVGD